MCWSTSSISRAVAASPATARERLLEVDLIGVHGNDGERRALPEVLVLDLGQRHVVAVSEPLLQAAQRLPLVLERARAREVQLES